MDFRKTSVVELAARVRDKRVSARELVQAALANIERLDPQYNTLCSVDAQLALADAEVADRRIANGERLALAG